MVLLPLDAFDAASRTGFAPLPSATKCKGLPEQLDAIFVSRLDIVAM